MGSRSQNSLKVAMVRNRGALSSSPSPSSDVCCTGPDSIPGCVTCKAKRLKCDEVKPSCQQCHKRNVTCGGYKKDYKWRAFEETTFTSKPAPSPKPKKSSMFDSTKTDEIPRLTTLRPDMHQIVYRKSCKSGHLRSIWFHPQQRPSLSEVSLPTSSTISNSLRLSIRSAALPTNSSSIRPRSAHVCARSICSSIAPIPRELATHLNPQYNQLPFR